MCLEEIITRVSGLPEVVAWPEMAAVFERSVRQFGLQWELPLMACRAVSGDPSAAIPGAAAAACMQVGLLLIDDMLDEDPRGIHLRIGQASTANLAFAFQAAAFRVIEEAQVTAERRSAVYASLAQMALKSSFGQNLDVQNLGGEENYWTIAQTKSSPFFGASFHTGALLGGASSQVAGTLRDLGFLVGEIFQVYDDLLDAFESPACPDWEKGRNNLAILYALTADHPERAQFEALIPRVDDLQALVEAQEIMVRCGAVSYCAYHIIRRYQMGLQLLGEIELADPAPMLDLLNGYPKPLVALLERVGARVPSELGVMQSAW